MVMPLASPVSKIGLAGMLYISINSVRNWNAQSYFAFGKINSQSLSHCCAPDRIIAITLPGPQRH